MSSRRLVGCFVHVPECVVDLGDSEELAGDAGARSNADGDGRVCRMVGGGEELKPVRGDFFACAADHNASISCEVFAYVKAVAGRGTGGKHRHNGG